MKSIASPHLRRLMLSSQAQSLASRNSGHMFQYPHGFQNNNSAYLHTPTERVE